MDGQESIEVRVARLEEWRNSVGDEIQQARAARADINDAIELLRVTVGTIGTKVEHMNTAIARVETATGETRTQLGTLVADTRAELKKAIDKVSGNIDWGVKIVLGAVILMILSAAVAVNSGHVVVK